MLRPRISELLVAVLVLVGVMSSTADAATWKSSNTASTATAPHARFVITPTQSTPAPIYCIPASPTTNTATGTLNGALGPAYPGAWDGAMTFTPTFVGCSVGRVRFTAACGRDMTSGGGGLAGGPWFDASSTTATSSSSGVTNGRVSNLRCTFTTGSCVIALAGGGPPIGSVSTDPDGAYGRGALLASFDNASRQLTVLMTGQTLAASWNAPCDFLFNNAMPRVGTAQLTTPGPSVANLVYTVTSPDGFALWQS